MTQQFCWQSSNDRRDLVCQLVERISQGQLALFPTSTTYSLFANPASAAALDRLAKVPRAHSWSPSLAIANVEDCYRLNRRIGTAGRRLLERGLPGPLVALLEPGANSDILPMSVRALVTHYSRLAVRVPDHSAILDVLRLFGRPLICIDGPPATRELDAALQWFSSFADVALDGQACRFGSSVTTVEIVGEHVRVLEEGIYSRARIQRLMSQVLTFVCTGNSCRSPMAEALMRKILADAIGCDANELPTHGIIVQSAGLAAMDGGSAAHDAQAIAEEHGASLADHISQSLTDEMVRTSDRLIVMTHEHREAIRQQWPEALPKVSLLAGTEDIADPIGQGIEQYRRCARQMESHLHRLATHITSDGGTAAPGEAGGS